MSALSREAQLAARDGLGPQWIWVPRDDAALRLRDLAQTAAVRLSQLGDQGLADEIGAVLRHCGKENP